MRSALDVLLWRLIDDFLDSAPFGLQMGAVAPRCWALKVTCFFISDVSLLLLVLF